MPDGQITTLVRDTSTGTCTTVEQHVEVDGAELVYTVEGKTTEVRVNAQQYVALLVNLTGWKAPRTARDRIHYAGDDE